MTIRAAAEVAAAIGESGVVTFDSDGTIRVTIQSGFRWRSNMPRLARVYAAAIRKLGYDVEHVTNYAGREYWPLYWDEPQWVAGSHPLMSKVEGRIVGYRAELLVRCPS